VSTRAGEQRVGFLLSSATLDRPASSLRRAGRDAEPSHHHRRSGCRPHHHILGATELLVASHFFLAVAPFVYPELLPDVPESAAVERRRRLLDAYTGEPPPSFLPLQCATHRAASRRRCAARAGRWAAWIHDGIVCAPSALAAVAVPPWAAWICAGTVCPGCWVTVLLSRALKSAHWPLNSFSIFLNIFKSLQVQKCV
jgi:hypothetical protein